jgi:acetylornithine deacetylase/succinyl-diaminopimelate desuccinylase-like protein
LAPRGKIKRRVLLAPHLDTVAGEGIDASFFTPRLKDGKLHGRGACDTKGCVAAMFAALSSLARGPKRPANTEIILAGLLDEENGQAGSRALVSRRFKADLAVVGEPTRLQVVTAHKGNIWLKIETLGKAAHGARPELGQNAVLAAAKVVQLLETEYAQALALRRHPLLGRATISVGTIKGGTQPNIVPDQCMITADRRILPGETERRVKREVAELLARHGIKATIGSTKNAPCAPMETDPALPLARALMKAAGVNKPAGVDYFCDASVLSHGGIPSVVFGPGDIAQAHTRDEWIALRSLERGEAILKSFLKSLA